MMAMTGIRLDDSIESLGFSARVNNCLKKKVKTIRDLMKTPVCEFAEIRSFGPKSYDEVLHVVKSLKKHILNLHGNDEGVSYITLSQALESLLNSDLPIPKHQKKRERRIVEMRYGIRGGCKHTLAEIASVFQITRERIRQILENLQRRMYHVSKKHILDPIIREIHEILKKNDGITRIESIVEELLEKFPSGNVNAEYTIKFFLAHDSEVQEIDRNLFGLVSYPLGLFDRINEEFIKILKTNGNQLALRDLLEEFAQTPFYLKFQEKLPPKFILASLKLNPEIETTESDIYRLVPKNLADYLQIAFEQVGEPLHFNRLTKEVNNIIKRNKVVDNRTVHGVLVRKREFERMARGTYGLRKWRLRSKKYIADLIYNILANAKGPLHILKIFEQIKQQCECNLKLLSIFLKIDERFVHIEGEMYGLKSKHTKRAEVTHKDEEQLKKEILERLKKHCLKMR